MGAAAHAAAGRRPRELLVDVNYNRPDVLNVELPAGNGIGEARAAGAAYSGAATGSLGLTERTLDALVQPAQPPGGGLVVLVLWMPTTYSLGYLKPTPDWPFGSTASAALARPAMAVPSAWPTLTPAFATATHRTSSDSGLTDQREIALGDAVHRAVLHGRPQHIDYRGPANVHKQRTRACVVLVDELAGVGGPGQPPGTRSPRSRPGSTKSRPDSPGDPPRISRPRRASATNLRWPD